MTARAREALAWTAVAALLAVGLLVSMVLAVVLVVPTGGAILFLACVGGGR